MVSPRCLVCGIQLPQDGYVDVRKFCSQTCKLKNKKKDKVNNICSKCGGQIPSDRRSDALYCTEQCKNAAEKLRYKARHPDYVERQNRKVKEIRHMKEFGHTRYINNPKLNPRDRYAAARAKGFRSMLEAHNAEHLEDHGVQFEYEPFRIPFTPATRHYTPDLVLENGIIIEAKGRFVSSDRAKHLLIKEQHPHLDVRFVFSNANNKLSKGSKTTYADWCKRHGFLWAEGLVPVTWMKEKRK